MSRHIRMGGLDVDIADAAFDDRLADAYSRREHPLCRCQADGVQMYIARFEDRHILKRMPGTGAQHAPDCESYEPPSDLSGLSAVEGEAIVENVEDGTTALKLGFSLSKLGGRTAPAIGDSADPGDVRTDGARLSLKAMLHFLWDRAQFNRWRPAMAGRRNWAVVRKFVVEAASSSSAKGKPLSDALYIPEMFDPERADAIVQRRQAFLSRAVQSQGNRRSLAILIGEVKEIQPARSGSRCDRQTRPAVSVHAGRRRHPPHEQGLRSRTRALGGEPGIAPHRSGNVRGRGLRHRSHRGDRADDGQRTVDSLREPVRRHAA
jgi:hypothetical protein